MLQAFCTVLILSLSYVATFGVKQNSICDVDCGDFNETCEDVCCSTEWAQDNCRMKCRQCIPCEKVVFVTDMAKVFEEIDRKLESLEMGLEEVFSRSFVRIKAVVSTEYDSATIVKGKVENWFDNDVDTCATAIHGHGSRMHFVNFAFPPAQVRQVGVYVRGSKTRDAVTDDRFKVTIYGSDDIFMHGSQTNKWHTHIVDSNTEASGGYLNLGFDLEELELCSVELYGFEM